MKNVDQQTVKSSPFLKMVTPADGLINNVLVSVLKINQKNSIVPTGCFLSYLFPQKQQKYT